MSLATFAAVWIATWAACWFIAPKWWRISGSREWAPILSTAVAFLVNYLAS